MAKLGDVCFIKGGYAFKSEKFSNSGVPVIRIGNITENGLEIDKNICFDENFWNENENYRVNTDDVLVAMSGATVGKSCINKFSDKLLLNQRVAAISGRQEIENKYIYYFISSPAFMTYVLNQSVGCAQPNISIKQLSDIELNVPSIAEQNQIVEKLSKLDDLIILRTKQLKDFETLVKSRFVELFGDVITNSKNWDVMTWNNVLTIKNGRNQKQVENPTGKYPICGSGGVMGYADDYITEKNSVIVGRKGNINKPILMREKFWNVDTAFGLEPNTDILLVDYLYLYCLFFDFETLNKAVTIPSLTKSDLLNIDMPVPPIDLQNEFAEFVEQTDKLKFEIKEALEKLETLKKSLMQQYFG